MIDFDCSPILPLHLCIRVYKINLDLFVRNLEKFFAKFVKHKLE